MKAQQDIKLLEAKGYTAVVASCSFPSTKKDGSPCTPHVKVGFKVDNQWVFYTGYLTPSAAVYTKKAMTVLGYQDGMSLEQFKEQAIGRDAYITVEHKEFGGQLRAEVAWVNPIKKEIDGLTFASLMAQIPSTPIENDNDL